MALLTALLTSAAVTSLVTWNESRYMTSSDSVTRVTTLADDISHTTPNDTGFRFPTTTSENYFRLRPTTLFITNHLRSQRVAITRSMRLYGVVVATCLAAVVAVSLAAACFVVHGGTASGTVHHHRRSWFRLFGRRQMTSDLAAATSGGDADYIYRPLGTGTGSRLDDEYETTFVGVSVPLLHDVRVV